MFLNLQNESEIKNYTRYLQLIGCLSNLFSESKTPYLYYRAAEKVFCKAFFADDLSRSDVSVDAMKNNTGIGLKTFLVGNSKTFQKVAEFNRDRNFYDSLHLKDKIIKISEMRNERIAFTERTFGINFSLYHCVVRDENKFKIYEEPINKINLNQIAAIQENSSSILFNDGLHEYSFLKSKSTLTKRFITSKSLFDIEVDILDDPLSMLEQLKISSFSFNNEKIKKTIYLPLYGRKNFVFEKSGLNQWNAGGRARDLNEVYIPIPRIVHELSPHFFPARDTPFNLKLPNGKILQTKVCQDGDKALMSYSNKELGQWLLRDVLKLKEGEILTYEKLQIIGIDTVRIDKIGDLDYEINFSKIGTFDRFVNQSYE